MKKIIFFVLFACTFLVNANQADAQIRIGAILNAPNEISTNTEQLEKLNIRLAELLPSDKYEVLPIQEMMEKEKEYRRNKNIFQAPNQLTPPALSQEALCELGKNSNCDYLVLIKQEYTDAVRKYVILVPGSPEKKINLTTNIKIFNIGTKQEKTLKEYKNRAGMRRGNKDLPQALVRAFDDFLKDLVIDPAKDIQ